MNSVADVAQRVLEANAGPLAVAGTTEAIEKLVPQIAEEIESGYNPRTDPFAYRAVIIILGIIAIIVAITYAWYTLTPDTVAADGKVIRKLRDLPDALIALGAAAVGALAGLLAPPPQS